MRKKAARHIVPIIEERYGLPPDERPNDFLSWLMEDAVGEEKDPYNLTLRILAVNFAAIHTTSSVSRFILTYACLTLHFHEVVHGSPVPTPSSVSHALETMQCPHDLVSPEYTQPLRDEVESIVKEQGWTKASLINMRKLDSFLREALRLSDTTTGEHRSALHNHLAHIYLDFQL
jgi:hypothetical protein